ncbi:hypothetical protein GOP47_0028093 [Adiantum capillus-veneris]|nr:hypothetical protein GOP47_0028093 [Adiantum capillus-veneris]
MLTHVNDSLSSTVEPIFGSRYMQSSLPRFTLPEREMSKDTAYQIVHDELLFDGNPRLNLASFVTTWMEPECEKLIMESLNKNYIDFDEYPATVDLQDRCVNMIARLFNAPVDNDEQAVGTCTVGSSEAIMLAGLAMKRKWQQRRKQEGKPYDKPNMIAGSNVQVCWEKFARYFEVELKEVKLREGYYVMDPVEAVTLVDENTILVCAILGSTYNGEFEDVKLLNDLLLKNNRETGWDTPIHVDAASGGFIAPFLYPDLAWDFRLPLVKSINVSGHKYGLVYAGVGWAIWRSKADLPEELIFHINYLGADQPTFTLNFSKGASHVIAQYYQFIRLGFEGYTSIVQSCQDNAIYLANKLKETRKFKIISKDVGVPVVAYSIIKMAPQTHVTEHDLAERMRQFGWIVPAYTMAPNLEHINVLRVVVREDFSRSQAERFVTDTEKAMDYLIRRLAPATTLFSRQHHGHEPLIDQGYQSEGHPPKQTQGKLGSRVVEQFHKLCIRRHGKGETSAQKQRAQHVHRRQRLAKVC